MNKIYQKTVLFIVLMVFTVLVGCSSSKNKIPKYPFMKVDEQEILASEAKDVRTILLNLDSTKYQFRNKPDYILYGFKDDSKYDMYCIYIDEELIYQGDVFKAMFDDLTSRKSNCLEFDKNAKDFFKDLKDSYVN